MSTSGDGRELRILHAAWASHPTGGSELGHYADVPYETIVAAFRQAHPRWLAHRTVAAAGDFASEAAAAD